MFKPANKSKRNSEEGCFLYFYHQLWTSHSSVQVSWVEGQWQNFEVLCNSSFRHLSSGINLLMWEGVLFALLGKSEKVIRKLGHIISRLWSLGLSPNPQPSAAINCLRTQTKNYFLRSSNENWYFGIFRAQKFINC